MGTKLFDSLRTDGTVEAPDAVSLGYDADQGVAVLEWSCDWRPPWEAEGQGEVPRWSERAASPCLREFAALADAQPGQVLDFARRHGVLGVNPRVRARETAWHYGEDVGVYRVLASQVAACLRAMRAVRSGAPVAADDLGRTDPISYCDASGLMAMLNGGGAGASPPAGACSAQDLSSSDRSRARVPMTDKPLLSGLVEAVSRAVPQWSAQKAAEIADAGTASRRSVLLYEALLSNMAQWEGVARFGVELRMQEGGVLAPCLNFGTWSDGYGWDISAPGLPVPTPWRPLPGPGQRASPLFNWLALQLMEELRLPPGTFFCSQCRRPFVPHLSGVNKPRSDKANGFCGAACRKAHRVEANRDRRHRGGDGGARPDS